MCDVCVSKVLFVRFFVLNYVCYVVPFCCCGCVYIAIVCYVDLSCVGVGCIVLCAFVFVLEFLFVRCLCVLFDVRVVVVFGCFCCGGFVVLC